MDVVQPNARSCPTAALAVIGKNFIVSLFSTLIALPVLYYFNGPTQLTGAPIFGNPTISLSDEMMLCLRIGNVVFTIAFFFLVGRFSIPLYIRAFGRAPGIIRLAIVLPSPLIFIALSTVLFTVLLQGLQGDNFSNALFEYTKITVWPFAFLPTVMGLLNGLRSPLPSDAQLSSDIKEDFEAVERGVEKLPYIIDRAAEVLDSAMKGNFTAMTLSSLSVTSIITAGISDNSTTFVLLFLLPMTVTFGSCVAYILIGKLRLYIMHQSPHERWRRLSFSVFAILLVPGLILVSIGCTVLVAHLVNTMYIDSAIPLTQFLRGLKENPAQIVAYAIILLIPMYWVIYFICLMRSRESAVEKVVSSDVPPPMRVGRD